MSRRLVYVSAIAFVNHRGYGGEALSTSNGRSDIGAVTASGRSMWNTLDDNVEGWKTIFGEHGERGEYMDGYPPMAMAERCKEDYKWVADDDVTLAELRCEMMARLYDNEELWESVSMVAFAEHYVLIDDETTATTAPGKPYETFQKHKHSQLTSSPHRPIFGGVVLKDWQSHDEDMLDQKLLAYQEREIDYIRMECNFGSADDVGGATQLINNPHFIKRFDRLAEAAKACQDREMVPLILLQVPWREPGGLSNDYFDKAVQGFASALETAGVESERLLFETRPPIGISAQEERGLGGKERIQLGLETGRAMFQSIDEAFGDGGLAGFCVAGGSTKGKFPTAMEDDTQNAVRQGMRQYARQEWGYDLCFWEMGAKLMLQPKVGRLWKNGLAGQAAARELFCLNAQDLADEVKAEIS